MSWDERAREAQRLTAHVGEADVDERLMALLMDAENTAVSSAAADALLDRRDLPGLALVVNAFADADEDARNKIGDCLYDDIGTRWYWVKDTLDAHANDPTLRPSGVDALRAHMKEQAESHRR